MLQHYNRREDLCDTRRIIFHMAVLSEKHRSRVHVHDSSGFRLDPRIGRPVRSRERLYRPHLGKYEHAAEYLCQFLF